MLAAAIGLEAKISSSIVFFSLLSFVFPIAPKIGPEVYSNLPIISCYYIGNLLM